MKYPKILLITFILIATLFIQVSKSSSDELDDINKKINDLTTALKMSQSATRPLESQLNSMQAQISDIKKKVGAIESDIAQKKKNIDSSYKNLAKQEAILNRSIRDFYIKSYYDSPFLIFLSGVQAQDLTKVLAYQKAASDQDKAIITNIALSISDLEEKKSNLEAEERKLADIKANLDVESAKLDKIVSGAKAYQNSLSGQITQLSAKQQQLLAEKLGSLNIPLFAYNTQGGCSSDLTNGKDPGFSGGFGLFTYGVPNRVGLNQYGAWGRAKQGQNSDTILHAYYSFDGYQNMNATIKVNDSNGFNSGNIIWTGSLDDYVKRVYEVPDSWTDNDLAALKAQAIAARSYVMASTNNGDSSICANQNCQVFKTDPKGGNWDSAVGQTSNQVMVQGGQVVKAWFSSTHGGYIFSSSDIGWSSTSFTKRAKDATGDINSFSDLQSKAYDKDSPWFYCDWGGRSAYNKTAWLKSEELADIVNSILLVQADNSTDSHILQTDKSYPEAWSEDKVKQELGKYRTPFSSISSGSVDADFNNGKTTQVHFSGNAGSVDFPADVFKKYFNLRAPSNINIVGPLYNIEKR